MLVALALFALANPGPSLLCGKATSFELMPGDTVGEITGGIHVGAAEVRTDQGQVRFDESDALKDGTPIGDWITAVAAERVRKIRLHDGTEVYAFYGLLPNDVLPFRPIALLSGPGLEFDESDLPLLNRIRVAVPVQSNCVATLNYGFDALFKLPPH